MNSECGIISDLCICYTAPCGEGRATSHLQKFCLKIQDLQWSDTESDPTKYGLLLKFAEQKLITHYKNAFFNNINKMRLSLDNAKCRCYNIKREYNA